MRSALKNIGTIRGHPAARFWDEPVDEKKLLQGYALSNSVVVAKEYVDVETAKQTVRANFGEMLRHLKKHPDIRILLVKRPIVSIEIFGIMWRWMNSTSRYTWSKKASFSRKTPNPPRRSGVLAGTVAGAAAVVVGGGAMALGGVRAAASGSMSAVRSAASLAGSTTSGAAVAADIGGARQTLNRRLPGAPGGGGASPSANESSSLAGKLRQAQQVKDAAKVAGQTLKEGDKGGHSQVRSSRESEAWRFIHSIGHPSATVKHRIRLRLTRRRPKSGTSD